MQFHIESHVTGGNNNTVGDSDVGAASVDNFKTARLAQDIIIENAFLLIKPTKNAQINNRTKLYNITRRYINYGQYIGVHSRFTEAASFDGIQCQ